MNQFVYHRTSVEDAKAMAAFVAELERQGIVYTVEHDTYKFYITVKGY